MDTAQVPAVSARRRARFGLTVALVTCVVLWVASIYFMSPDEDRGTWGAGLTFVVTMILYVLPFLNQGGRVRLHEPGRRYLTAWTISGWRTVDLHRLMRISRFHMPSSGKDVDMLVLVDVDEVRLMLNNEEVDQAVKQALADHPNDAIRISPAAEYRLGLSTPSPKRRLWWFVRLFATPFLLLPLWLGLTVLATLAAEVVAAAYLASAM
jgi:hypothetical protein